MGGWLALIPLVSAVLGWCINRVAIRLLLYRILPADQGRIKGELRRKEFAERLHALIRSFFLQTDLEETIASPDKLQKIMPEIEAHIDQFLRVRLPQSMPVIGMFVGEKTISQLKEVFMKELENLFPVIMKSYLGQLEKDTDFSELILKKLDAYPNSKLRVLVRESLGREIRMAEILGAVSGFIIGTIQLVILLNFRS